MTLSVYLIQKITCSPPRELYGTGEEVEERLEGAGDEFLYADDPGDESDLMTILRLLQLLHTTTGTNSRAQAPLCLGPLFLASRHDHTTHTLTIIGAYDILLDFPLHPSFCTFRPSTFLFVWCLKTTYSSSFFCFHDLPTTFLLYPFLRLSIVQTLGFLNP
jgi:hypothetical protein